MWMFTAVFWPPESEAYEAFCFFWFGAVLDDWPGRCSGQGQRHQKEANLVDFQIYGGIFRRQDPCVQSCGPLSFTQNVLSSNLLYQCCLLVLLLSHLFPNFQRHTVENLLNIIWEISHPIHTWGGEAYGEPWAELLPNFQVGWRFPEKPALMFWRMASVTFRFGLRSLQSKHWNLRGKCAATNLGTHVDAFIKLKGTGIIVVICVKILWGC